MAATVSLVMLAFALMTASRIHADTVAQSPKTIRSTKRVARRFGLKGSPIHWSMQ
jgi:hypothetical protein